MASMIGSCVGTCLGACACQGLVCCNKAKSSSKMPYVFVFFAMTVLALILRYWGGPMLVHLYIYDMKLCDTDKCVGFGAVFRISFTLFSFFAFMALTSYANIRSLQEGCWVGKFAVLIGTLVGSYLLPDQFYDGYSEAARFVAGAFLVLQILYLINFAIAWNSDWLREDKDWKAGILFMAALFYILSLVALCLLYSYFGGTGCHLNQFLITLTLIFTLGFTAISISEVIKHGALLPSAVVTLYSYWVLYSALASDPSECNAHRSNDEVSVIMGLSIAAISITYAAYNTASTTMDSGSSEAYADLDDPADAESGMTRTPSERSRLADDEDSDGSTSSQDQGTNPQFFWLMAMGAMYMAMLLTNWGSRQEAQNDAHGTDADDVLQLSKESMWVKIVSQWLTGILYTWSLLAPWLFPDRDFGVGVEY